MASLLSDPSGYAGTKSTLTMGGQTSMETTILESLLEMQALLGTSKTISKIQQRNTRGNHPKKAITH